MKFKSVVLPVVLLAGVLSAFYFYSKNQHKHIVLFSDSPESDEGDELQARTKWEIMRLADPATGKIPDHIREQELAYASTLPKFQSSFNARTTSAIPQFTPRGPWNVGGRSRSLAIDITNENIIFCGSVNGGLWRSADGGGTWTMVSRKSQIPAISSVVQDKRPGHTNTWYYGTGETSGGSASGAYALYTGNGIYKSVDSGLTWDSLPATYTATADGLVGAFELNMDLALDSSDHINDRIYDATTFYGIRTSKDGGNTWTVDLNTNAYYTDVKVSPTGIVYATASKFTSQGNLSTLRGIYRKQDTTWTRISPSNWDTTAFDRYVIGINPSNENEVYFLGCNTNYHGKELKTFLNTIEWNSLWKYTYLSGHGDSTGGLWQDLSPNLPGDTSNSFYNFYSQGGYDLVVSVHPDSSNIVYIGGTNLYRSTDGFTSTNHTKVIGGYDPSSSLPFYRLYPNHHPDQHNMAFLSNHNVMIETNDGGIFKTMNNQADSVMWQSLDNGYLTSQLYTVAINHGPVPDNVIIGGLQDNGSWFTNNTTLTRPWAMPGAGDGAFCYITDGDTTYYMSRNQGTVAKVTLDTAGEVSAFRRIDPIDGVSRNNYLFVNPFVVDPNNNYAMFMAAGNHVWRNDSLNAIALNNQWDSIRQGWFEFPDSATGLSVTALAMSKNPSGRLYYGTSSRKIYRVDNPYSASPTRKEITGLRNPGIFPGSGYINCIAVDPTDANKVMVVFSNYNIYSLYYTTKGDTPWVKIGGNLEPSNNTGPSLRWASIIPVSSGNVYLVGTSVGLFGTSTIDSTRTVWTQLDPNGIGNMVVDMIDYRSSDNLVAVATHGGGVYTATITDILPTGITDLQTSSMAIVNVYPNPATTRALVSFTLGKAENVSLKVYDIKGTLIQTLMQGKLEEGAHQFVLDRKNMSAGIYFVNIKAGESLNETRKIIFGD